MRAALRHARGPDWRDAGHQAESRVAGRRCRQARAHTTRGCRPGRPGRLRSPPSRRARFRARRRRARETRQLRETVRVRVGGVRGESCGPRGGPRGALGRCAPVRPRQVRPPDTSPDSVPRHLRTLRATARAARGAENAVRSRAYFYQPTTRSKTRAPLTHIPPFPPLPRHQRRGHAFARSAVDGLVRRAREDAVVLGFVRGPSASGVGGDARQLGRRRARPEAARAPDSIGPRAHVPEPRGVPESV